jgi:hypothetical protein
MRAAGKDSVNVGDMVKLLTRNGVSGSVIDRVVKEASGLKEMPTVEGHFSMVARERGKVVHGTHRKGQNIWTLTGREYLAQLMSYQTYGPPVAGERRDRMRYIGFGTGSQPEVSSVSSLVTPITFNGSNSFLAQVSLPTYPLSPSRTTVRYSRIFTEAELSVVGTVTLTEAGLFTDGDPGTSFDPETRDITLANALVQSPNAYKVFEPLSKTQNFVLEVSWEIRF